MRRLQIIGEDEGNLYGQLVKKELEFVSKNKGTFRRSGPKAKGSAKWKHSTYKGWVSIQNGMGNVVIVEIGTRAERDVEWQILQAFLGFLDRHFSKQIRGINIQF